MHPSGSDADLGAEAEFAASANWVEAFGGRSPIDLPEERLRRRFVFGDYAVGVVRAVGLDMVDRRLEAVDDPDRDDRVEIFGPPIFLGRGRTRGSAARAAASPRTAQPARISASISGLSRRAAAVRWTSSVSAAPQTPVRRIFALTTILNALSRSAAGRRRRARPLEMGEDRNARLALHPLDQAPSAARHDHVERAAEPSSISPTAAREAKGARETAASGSPASPQAATRQSWIAAEE